MYGVTKSIVKSRVTWCSLFLSRKLSEHFSLIEMESFFNTIQRMIVIFCQISHFLN